MRVLVGIEVGNLNACALQLSDLCNDLGFDLVCIQSPSGCASRKADDALAKIRPGIRD